MIFGCSEFGTYVYADTRCFGVPPVIPPPEPEDPHVWEEVCKNGSNWNEILCPEGPIKRC